ncbi:AGCS family amino acid carrier protein [Chlamydia trachomatis]|uniref:AGCS family amino acid carrier protein n=1 Tax=Chlamydia trachomatis TaxID=813 RepID=UPI0001B46FFF|nr:AGCS family amino acid carrier protein [Chlamydia trachomatis]ADH17181.1 Sodium/alanine symporter protein [Chlamydia trachomatis E/150]ADH20876.1 Sodium/alanine symporter protein [Chlamydia trachomatis E/11023]AGR93830.1 Sodium/alanine symporter protein [Chlamydia trachomatis RC-F/69]AGR95674.1 Sodium/alanine symporter protein [Chlamydia trachomatis RC-F(s)/852]AGR99392.1 Sodium/alanine symporter protein [Chlamydia trachomatis RC-F(s)/342]
MSAFLSFLTAFDDFIWSYIAFVLILLLGVLFTCKSKFAQFTQLPAFFKLFYHFSKEASSKKENQKKGVHPLKVFFASAGGNIGIGNVVGIVTAASVGGPGALFWVWIAGILGSIVKYSEVYLGIKFRQSDANNMYHGGPMFFLDKAYRTRIVSVIVAVLLCIYGVEIYQFSIIANTLASCWDVPKLMAIASLLFLVMYAVQGGLQRIGKICSLVLPFFMLVYCGMAFYILIQEIHTLPALFSSIFRSAFTGHGAIGGFAGCTVASTIRQGLSRAAYSGDIGIGFDSIIQSETSATNPQTQAQLSIVGVIVDNLVCTLSLLIVLASGVWHRAGLEGSEIVEQALFFYFPYIRVFLPAFLFATGYTTIISYFLVGKKCANFICGNKGSKFYTVYGIIALPAFCFLPQDTALLVMSVSGALLLCLNLLGVFLMRKELIFPKKEAETLEVSESTLSS